MQVPRNMSAEAGDFAEFVGEGRRRAPGIVEMFRPPRALSGAAGQV